MKKLLTILLFTALFSHMALAQRQTLQVIYAAKDYTTDANVLCEQLKDIYSSALRDESQAVIFYLPNSTSPMIVKVNLPGDNRDSFENLIEALMTKSETIINPNTDLNGIVSLFNDVDVLDSEGSHAFLDVEILYYITPTFWDLGYNEAIIASAYFALEMDADWADGYFNMSIFHGESDDLVVDDEHPFGLKNLCKNYKFFLLTY